VVGAEATGGLLPSSGLRLLPTRKPGKIALVQLLDPPPPAAAAAVSALAGMANPRSPPSPVPTTPS
jgi:hypothetical protein